MTFSLSFISMAISMYITLSGLASKQMSEISTMSSLGEPEGSRFIRMPEIAPQISGAPRSPKENHTGRNGM